jgi:transposase-like protein
MARLSTTASALARQVADTRKRAWLEAFEAEGTVRYACKVAGVGRSTVYEWRQKDEAFALAWADIEEATTEAMEREAYRRAVEGVTEPLVSAGKRVCDTTKFSDTLLIFMLKARRPEKYRDNVRVEHSGTVQHEVSLPTEIDWHAQVAAVLANVGAVDSDAVLLSSETIVE